jgi:hypothetical protein
MHSPFVRLAVVAAGVVLAAVAVYGWRGAPTAAPLRGQVLVSALAGGVALAFSRPFLLVLVPYLTVLLLHLKKEPAAAGGGDWRFPAIYVGGFGLAFVPTISGMPEFVATAIHRSDRIVDAVSGTVLSVWGLVTFAGLLPPRSFLSVPTAWKRAVLPVAGGAVGAAAGLVAYHALDPAYDSVFFATGNVVAASHAWPTVAVFAGALGLTYLAASRGAAAIAGLKGPAPAILSGIHTLSAILTVWIGLAALTGRLEAIRGLLS